jgi:hypothetical protein
VRTDDLIVELARRASPVRPLAPPVVRCARWAGAMVLLSAAGVLLLGPRADLTRALVQPAYAARLVITLLTAALASLGAFALSVPNADRSPLTQILPYAAFASWILLLTALLFSGGQPIGRLLAFPVNWPCSYKIFGFSLIPGVALWVLIGRAAPLEVMQNAATAALAATTLGAVATQLICPVDDPAHQLVGHVLPVVVLAVIGLAAGYRTLERTIARF